MGEKVGQAKAGNILNDSGTFTEAMIIGRERDEVTDARLRRLSPVMRTVFRMLFQEHVDDSDLDFYDEATDTPSSSSSSTSSSTSSSDEGSENIHRLEMFPPEPPRTTKLSVCEVEAAQLHTTAQRQMLLGEVSFVPAMQPADPFTHTHTQYVACTYHLAKTELGAGVTCSRRRRR